MYVCSGVLQGIVSYAFPWSFIAIIFLTHGRVWAAGLAGLPAGTKTRSDGLLGWPGCSPIWLARWHSWKVGRLVIFLSSSGGLRLAGWHSWKVGRLVIFLSSSGRLRLAGWHSWPSPASQPVSTFQPSQPSQPSNNFFLIIISAATPKPTPPPWGGWLTQLKTTSDFHVFIFHCRNEYLFIARLSFPVWRLGKSFHFHCRNEYYSFQYFHFPLPQ